jgi:hypothetical protein
MITGINRGSMVALLQSNFGSNVASQGYPNRTSSLSYIRNKESHFLVNSFSNDI